MFKFMINVIGLLALLVLAQNSFSTERPEPNLFEVRNMCLQQIGLPVPVTLMPAKPPKMTDSQKQAMLDCFQSHGVDTSRLPPLR